MIETINYRFKNYPKFQASGNAARFIIPFASEVCHGFGYDIGAGRRDWSFSGSIPIDPSINWEDINGQKGTWDANNLPDTKVDYIFSSHCLEHVPDWMKTLDYWISKIVSGGTLFLYLPDHSQNYWAYGNVKHVSIFTPKIIRGFLDNRSLNNVFVSGVDLNNSFACMAEVS